MTRTTAPKPTRKPAAKKAKGVKKPDRPRTLKKDRLVEMLRRPEGATISPAYGLITSQSPHRRALPPRRFPDQPRRERQTYQRRKVARPKSRLSLAKRRAYLGAQHLGLGDKICWVGHAIFFQRPVYRRKSFFELV
jgi:hypothetical protein